MMHWIMIGAGLYLGYILIAFSLMLVGVLLLGIVFVLYNLLLWIHRQ